MSSDQVTRTDLGGGVTELALNRPDKLNALSRALIAELAAQCAACGSDDSVSVVVIKGNGRSFCVGADASGGEIHDSTPWADRQSMAEGGWGEFLCVWDMPKPVIVQVHGHCLGIATILCNLADLVIVADDARIGWPALPLGGGVISPTWVWHVGLHKAKEFSYQVGSQVSGQEAVQLGFANRSVPADQLEDDVRETARRIARVPVDLLRVKKAALNEVWERQGFRQAVLAGANWGALSHSVSGTADVRNLIAERGLKGAIAFYQDGA
jgi:enoyl-CoA hydratase